MLALSGYPLDLGFRILDPAPDACAGQVVADHVVAGFDDKPALQRFAAGLDVATYEWENVPVESVRYLSRFVRVYPPVEALEVSQDRFLEKSLFHKFGIETAPYAAVDSLDGLRGAAEVTGLPAILKTRRLGYDGKGQYRLDSAADIEPAWQALGGSPLVLEGLVPFARELSVLAVRGTRRNDALDVRRIRRSGAGLVMSPSPGRAEEEQGRSMAERMARLRDEALSPGGPWDRPRRGISDSAFFPLVENVHRDGILRTSRAPAPGLTPELQMEAEDIAALVLEATGYVGLLAIELFEHEGRLLASEMAPRVHNSGHWTIEGAETSQFENHLRAVCGLPLGATTPRGHSAMVNLIGRIPELGAVLRIPGAHLHIYGKEPRSGRKVGHITVRADEASAIENSLSQIARLIEN